MSVNPSTLQNLSDFIPLPPGGQSPDLGDSKVLHVVTGIYRGRFAKRLIRMGMEREDAYHAVILGLLVKARLPGSRWNPARGGLSTWAFVAISGIVENLIDQHVRSERRNGSTGLEHDVADEYSTTQTLAALGDRRGCVPTHQDPTGEHEGLEGPSQERRSRRVCRLHTEPEEPPLVKRDRYRSHVRKPR